MLFHVLSVPRVSTYVKSEGDLMISVTLCNAVFISRSSLPVNEETEVSELKVAMSSLSCHASSKWLLSLAHVYKAVVTWKDISDSQQRVLVTSLSQTSLMTFWAICKK